MPHAAPRRHGPAGRALLLLIALASTSLACFAAVVVFVSAAYRVPLGVLLFGGFAAGFVWLARLASRRLPSLARRSVVAFAALLMLGPWAWGGLRHGYGYFDSLFTVAFGVDALTIYAPDYSDEAFARVRFGDTRDEVLALLGEPLRFPPWPSSDTYFCYSGSKPYGTHHHERDVVFDEAGRVTEIVHRLHID